MYFAGLAVILSSCYIIAGFSLHGHEKRLNFLLREIIGADALSNYSFVETKWIAQPVDHFDDSDKRTWKMKYFQRLDMWEPNGPVYLFVNGESEALDYFLKAGFAVELARETKGAMFLSEHRYYGDSKPFEEFTTENLIYLSSRQALADNAILIKNIRSNPLYRSSKIVVVGGSYAGSLAAWMRLLYPDLVDAAIASSAPVLAKADFFEYLETVGDDYKEYGTPDCYDRINKKFERYQKLLETDDGIKLLKEEEQICNDTDMNNFKNQNLFFSDKSSQYEGIAQYGDADSLEEMCNNISLGFTSRYDEMDTWIEERQCHDYDFDKVIEYIKNSEGDSLSWIYQTCTEFGYFQTMKSEMQPFTNNIPIDFYYDICTALFGLDFDGKRVNEGVRKTNEMYGGLSPNVTKVIFVNGELDPWHRLSVLKDLSNEAPAKFIPLSSHCRDMMPDASDDSKELREARNYTKNLVKKWIGAGVLSSQLNL